MNTMGAIRRRYVDVPRGQVHCRCFESNPSGVPLMLLHPSPLSGIVWDTFIPEIGRDRMVVAPDTPGFGESSPPETAPEISDYAVAMHAVVSSLSLGPVDVMGYHTGSLTAVEMARQYPDLIRKVVMISATVFTDEERDEFRRQYTPKTLDEKGDELSQRWQFMKDFWRDEPDPARRWEIFLESQRHHTHSHWGHAAAFNYDLEQHLKDLDKPVLVLNPEDDLWTYTPRAAPLLRNGRVHDLPGWTHGFLDVHTNEIAHLVRTFLDT